MPGAAFHSHFWAGSADAPAPDPGLGASASGGYIPWMTTITATGLGLLVHVPQVFRAPCR